MNDEDKLPFHPHAFLSKVDGRRTVTKYPQDQVIYEQGEPASAVFFLQKGRAKITVLSEQGKEAVVAFLRDDEFFGEGVAAALTGALLALAIVLYWYDAFHKGNPIAPVIMGLCRALVYCGGGAPASGNVPVAIIVAALALLAYVAGLTYAARQESFDQVGNLWPLVVLMVPMLLALPALANGVVATLVYLAQIGCAAYADLPSGGAAHARRGATRGRAAGLPAYRWSTRRCLPPPARPCPRLPRCSAFRRRCCCSATFLAHQHGG